MNELYKPKIIEKKCEYCGATFKTTNSNVKYCSNECRRLRKNEKMNKLYKHKLPKLIEKKCEFCGKKFFPKNSHSKYCCSECKRSRQKERIKLNSKKIKNKKDKFIYKFRYISQRTGLSYGIVKAYYPDMVYIQKMAEYKLYARTGRKSDFTWLKAINTQTESVFTMYIN